MHTSRFHVYAIDYGVEMILFIIVVGYDSHRYYAEYFILTEGDENNFIVQRKYYDNIHGDSHEIKLENLKEETILPVGEKVREYLSKKYEETKDQIYLNYLRKKVELCEDNDEWLLYFCRHGIFHEEIGYIKKKTLCEKLKDYLENLFGCQEIKSKTN
jgi:hypothetical protein